MTSAKIFKVQNNSHKTDALKIILVVLQQLMEYIAVLPLFLIPRLHGAKV